MGAFKQARGNEMGSHPGSHKNENAAMAVSSYSAQVSDARAVSARSASPRRSGGNVQHPHDMAALILLGEKMLRSARLHRLPLAFLVAQVTDLPELEILFGRDAANQVVHAVMKELSALAGRAGLTLRAAPDTFTLLIPRCQGQQVERALRARLGRACSIEIDFEGEELVLVPEIQSCTVADGESIESTYRALCRAVESRRYLEQLRHEHLRREREAHSTHMGIPRELSQGHSAGASRTGSSWSPTMPATIAMPLGETLG